MALRMEVSTASFRRGPLFLKEAAVIGEIFFSECASRAVRAKISLIDGRRDFID